MKDRIWLKQLRGKKTQAEIAEPCGITVQMYSHIEKGLRRPSVAVSKRLGDALGFDWTRFFSEQDTDTVDELLKNTDTTS